MAFIKSPYENIYDETLYNGNGYYNSNGTFITDKTFKYMDKQRTDFLGRGYVVMRNYTLPYFMRLIGIDLVISCIQKNVL